MANHGSGWRVKTCVMDRHVNWRVIEYGMRGTQPKQPSMFTMVSLDAHGTLGTR